MSGFASSHDDGMRTEAVRGAELRLLSGIAQPAGFVRTVEALGARVAGLQARGERHPYGGADVARLDAALADGGDASAGGAAGASRWWRSTRTIPAPCASMSRDTPT